MGEHERQVVRKGGHPQIERATVGYDLPVTLNPLARALLLAASISASGLAGQAPDPHLVLDSAYAVFKRAPTVCADFEQIVAGSSAPDRQTHGSGRVCARHPNHFSMRFGQPEGDLYVADGRTLWRYLPSRNPREAYRIELAAAPKGIDFFQDFLGAATRDLHAKYQGREALDGRATHRVALTPLRRTTYRAARLWIDAADHLLRKVEITEGDGSVRTVVLRAIDADPQLVGDPFRFAPPPGAVLIAR